MVDGKVDAGGGDGGTPLEPIVTRWLASSDLISAAVRLIHRRYATTAFIGRGSCAAPIP